MVQAELHLKKENHSGGHFRYYRKLFKKFNRSQAKNIALGQKYLKELIREKKYTII